jgi:hypothetical protein
MQIYGGRKRLYVLFLEQVGGRICLRKLQRTSESSTAVVRAMSSLLLRYGVPIHCTAFTASDPRHWRPISSNDCDTE